MHRGNPPHKAVRRLFKASTLVLIVITGTLSEVPSRVAAYHPGPYDPGLMTHRVSDALHKTARGALRDAGRLCVWGD